MKAYNHAQKNHGRMRRYAVIFGLLLLMSAGGPLLRSCVPDAHAGTWIDPDTINLALDPTRGHMDFDMGARAFAGATAAQADRVDSRKYQATDPGQAVLHRSWRSDPNPGLTQDILHHLQRHRLKID